MVAARGSASPRAPSAPGPWRLQLVRGGLDQRLVGRTSPGRRRRACGWSGRAPRALQAARRPEAEWAPLDSDWELAPPPGSSEEEDDDLFPLEEGERQVPEFFLQNVLAVGLITLLGLSVGSVLLKLAFVTYALLAAAFRYTVVAFLIIVLFALFT